MKPIVWPTNWNRPLSGEEKTILARLGRAPGVEQEIPKAAFPWPPRKNYDFEPPEPKPEITAATWHSAVSKEAA